MVLKLVGAWTDEEDVQETGERDDKDVGEDLQHSIGLSVQSKRAHKVLEQS